ncbi:MULTISPECIES: sporulation phosphorelay system protein KapB [Virgibacillus]|uniref:Kinase-associated lipoprotein B n=2 Tax=Virgibacillus TaxID=84406 RepID=A0A024Q9K7_9BACI|nr:MULTISPECIES: sporulation phosphorelay system protein KapB [Virgibacillus]EQB37279.1 hypothetical protein M948_01720 [Virgibacillus sp. CM-4]MYL40035.1 kinase [Virgibacillus massiliensis]GGJ62660.1 kinase-associated lipoprotein B [Virgibacillus kapii]CDQ39223.1 Kinase-associated lipoprotein B precursor [Virgibacillus massiliensis]
MPEVQLGDTVKAHYKSGTYIGKAIADKGDRYVIEVLAVKKHPMQGDLHNPHQTEGVFFHERKALAYHEKMNVKKPAVHPHSELIPDYKQSLRQAVNDYKEKLTKEETTYNQAAMKCLQQLEQTYFK